MCEKLQKQQLKVQRDNQELERQLDIAKQELRRAMELSNEQQQQQQQQEEDEAKKQEGRGGREDVQSLVARNKELEGWVQTLTQQREEEADDDDEEKKEASSSSLSTTVSSLLSKLRSMESQTIRYA